jgi:small subunit ribosomal protein S16
MQRAGKTNRPFYKIVAAHSTRKRDGDFIEKIGTFNSLTVPATATVDETKAIKWLQCGAQPSETVRSILRGLGILHKSRLIARGLTPDQIQIEMDNWKMKQAAKTAAKRIKKTKALKKKTGKPAEETPAQA